MCILRPAAYGRLGRFISCVCFFSAEMWQKCTFVTMYLSSGEHSTLYSILHIFRHASASSTYLCQSVCKYIGSSYFGISILPLNISVQQSSLMSMSVSKVVRVYFRTRKCIWRKCIFWKCISQNYIFSCPGSSIPTLGHWVTLEFWQKEWLLRPKTLHTFDRSDELKRKNGK